MMKPALKVINSLNFKCFTFDEYINDKPVEDVVSLRQRIFTCSKRYEIEATIEKSLLYIYFSTSSIKCSVSSSTL